MPFWDRDRPYYPGTSPGAFKPDPVRSSAGGIPGHAPVNSSSIFDDILGGLLGAGLLPHFGPRSIPGHGTMAPDSSPIIQKGWESDPGASNSGNSLYEQLLALALGQGGGPDNAGLASQAQHAVNAQYDPQIAALQRAMEASKGRAATSRVELGNMYASLHDSELADIPKITQIFNEGAQGVKQQYDQLGQQVAGDYKAAEQQEQQLMQRLNLQAAAPDIMAQQSSDQQFFKGQQGQSEQDTLDALKLIQSGSEAFTREGAQMAQYEGTNRQADVMSQLEQFLTNTTGQIGDLQGAKQNAYMSMLGQLQNSAQSQYSQQQNQLFERLLDIAKLQQSGMQGGINQYKAGPLAASQYLGSSGAQNPEALNSFLLQTLQDPTIQSGRTMGPDGRPTGMTPEAAASLAQQKAAAAGMSPQSQQQIYMAMLAYMGRLY